MAGDLTTSLDQPSQPPLPLAQTCILSHHYDPNIKNPQRSTPEPRFFQVNHNRPPIESHPYRERNAYWKKRSQCITSFYFTNFTENWTAKPIWEVFAKYGAINDLYIPTKRDAQGKKFGFVRFQDVEDSSLLEGKLGQTKLKVNLSRFGRKQGSGEATQLRKCEPEGRLANDQDATVSVQVKQPYLHALMNTKAGRTERIGGNERGKGEWSGLEYKVSKENMEWLQKCHVGALRNPNDIQILPKKLQVEGHGVIKLTPMGGYLVLLQGEGDAAFQNLALGSKNWVESWFQFLRPWETRDVAMERIVWVRCTGIPLHAWSEDFFRYLTSDMGIFLNLDDDTKNETRFDVGRAQIRTTCPGPIDKTISARINGESFAITVEEEQGSHSMLGHSHQQKKMQKSQSRRSQAARRRQLS